MRIFCFLFLFVTITGTALSQGILDSDTYDSILKFRKLGDDRTKTLGERFEYAKKAVELSNDLKVDSIILRSNRILSTVYLFQGEYDKFSSINYKNLKLSKRTKDTLAIGIAHHNLGWYHYQVKMQSDSAYYYYTNAIKLYDQVGELLRQAQAMSNLASLQKNEKDYLGSEETAVNALKIYNQLPKTEMNLEDTWILNNLLGVISISLNNYDKALDYNFKAISVTERMKDGLLDRLSSQNNIAFVYKQKGDLNTSLKLYREVLANPQLFDLDPTFYALVSNNVAYTGFLNGEKDYDHLEKVFKRAYKIADSLDDPITKMATTIDMARFYKARNNMDSSLRYATETYNLAKLTSENDMLLESMKILSEIVPGEQGKKFLNEHIKLSDSLLQHERGIRNKFARVQYETDQIEQENERISTQRFWLLMISIVLVLTLFLLYIIITQRTKNKALEFERQQQQTNEEIYNLMLSQQDKVDEARANEKKRISQEMHDGVLGRLFGTRLSLDSLNLVEGKEAMTKRSAYIADLKNIEQDIRKISHDLNTDFVAGSGFMDIVETLIQNQTQAYQLAYEFYYSDDINWENISNKTKIHIYRILQETMQNIYKHAEASVVKISFHLNNDVILLTINDDGKGFILNKSKKGIGLKNINARVNEVNGTVQFDSEDANGTTITIQIPYSK